MKLYDYAKAPSPRRARMAIAEKGLNVELVPVDLWAREQLSDAFKSVNPQALVPALLTDDGQVITENIAIAAYLDALEPEPPLFGTSPLERARVLEWNARIEFELFMPTAEAFRNAHPNFKGRALPGPDDYEQIEALAERGRRRAPRFWPSLDLRLAASRFVSGEQFGFADITAVTALDFAAMVGLGPDPSLSHIGRWLEEAKARPSYTA
jgi:glutathione S-transferase